MRCPGVCPRSFQTNRNPNILLIYVNIPFSTDERGWNGFGCPGLEQSVELTCDLHTGREKKGLEQEQMLQGTLLFLSWRVFFLLFLCVCRWSYKSPTSPYVLIRICGVSQESGSSFEIVIHTAEALRNQLLSHFCPLDTYTTQ